MLKPCGEKRFKESVNWNISKECEWFSWVLSLRCSWFTCSVFKWFSSSDARRFLDIAPKNTNEDKKIETSKRAICENRITPMVDKLLFISPLCSPSGFVPCDNKLVIKKRNVFFTCLQRILFEEFFCLKLSSKIINIKRQSAFESSFPLLDLHASAFSLKIRSLDFSRNIYETFPARYLLTTT